MPGSLHYSGWYPRDGHDKLGVYNIKTQTSYDINFAQFQTNLKRELRTSCLQVTSNIAITLNSIRKSNFKVASFKSLQ